MIFLDTCLLIDYSKEKIDIELSKNYCISSIVSMEFKVGALNKRELKKINRILSNINIVEIDQSILDLADLLVEKYSLSHNMGIYDAIIAATCLVYGFPLWTYNSKDFRFINGLELIND
ncbi:MAG: type II toxin-antitoxin system VapC family toxin [Campylobacterota bacterium]|nr:type II toxin-antitoxin system VapC family toxin [Campylobacterota bacterium]